MAATPCCARLYAATTIAPLCRTSRGRWPRSIARATRWSDAIGSRASGPACVRLRRRWPERRSVSPIRRDDARPFASKPHVTDGGKDSCGILTQWLLAGLLDWVAEHGATARTAAGRAALSGSLVWSAVAAY